MRASGTSSSSVSWRSPTQRPGTAERLPCFFENRPVPGNVWLGVTVEDRHHGLPRIDFLRPVAARARFLSVEPLLEDLGPLDPDGIGWTIVGGITARRMRHKGRLGAHSAGDFAQAISRTRMIDDGFAPPVIPPTRRLSDCGKLLLKE